MTDTERLALFDQHRGDALDLARRMARKLPRFVRCDDLEAAALVGLWQAAKKWEPARSEFERYSASVVYNAVVDWLRHERGRLTARKQKTKQLNDHDRVDGRRDELQLVDLRDEVAFILGTLKPKHRRLVVAYYLEGKTGSEASQEAGKTRSWAYHVLPGLLARMRERLTLRD